MKSFVRHAILFGMAIILAGCVSSVVDPLASNPVPASSVGSYALAPTPTSLPTSGVPTVVPTATLLPIPATGGRVASAGLNQANLDPRADSDLRANPKTWLDPSPTSLPPTSAPPVARPSRPFETTELYVHVPPQANSRQPLRVLVVLHGMGGRGDAFSQSLIKDAERNNWVLIAPTFQYQNYLDPKLLREDDIVFGQRILDTLNVLPQRLNLKLRQRVLLYGFSRGAQLAHRFAYFYPDRVASVVALSAGAYTMPTEKRTSEKDAPVIPFPYGVGDLRECVGQSINWQALKKISFWIGVGAQDNNANDVARAFDQYGGKTRVDRAKSFQQALQTLGIDARLVIFPDASHDLTGQMRVNALKFLRDDELADNWND